RKTYSRVFVCDDILRYIMDIVEKTRVHPDLALGVSPRGSQALLKAAQVYAIIRGRNYVSPDDIKDIVKPVLSHRIMLEKTVGVKDNQTEKILDNILDGLNVPAEETVLPQPEQKHERGMS
ncbi:MAG TPA: magnesium chelatase, partial [Bacillota bacterium]|nr:magnesium chelatase [Bacillota bacterium]